MKGGKLHKQPGRWLLAVVILVLALGILVPQAGELSQSWHTIRSAYWPHILSAVALWGWTFLPAAAVYAVISPRKLQFRQTLLIQIACGFSNRLIPAGAGALATNARYLVRKGYTSVQAGTIVAINNVVGFAASIIVLVGAGLVNGLDVINGIRFEVYLSDRLVLAVLVITLLVMGYAWFARLPRKLVKTLRRINYQIEDSLLRSKRLINSLILSMGVTLGYGLCLYFVALACNVPLSAFQTMLVLTVGTLIASMTPTPGGIGGAEAGLVGILNALGVDIHQALSVALCYRAITYWLPLLPGYVALERARQQGLL